MKTRSDFVSNSSSASFIVDVANVKEDMWPLMKEMFDTIESITFLRNDPTDYSDRDPDQFSMKVVNAVKASDTLKMETNDNEGIEFKNRNIKFSKINKRLLNMIFKESTFIYCYFGCDDCGDYGGMVNQYGLLMELAGAKVIPDYDAQTSYQPLKFKNISILKDKLNI